jgi:arsenate reductase
MDRTRVLFLCTGNSARSIIAEALLRRIGADAFDVHSAGVEPRGVRPETLHVLEEAGIDVSGLRSEHLDAYTQQCFDYVITLCDDAEERCPTFPRDTRRLHWSLRDPAAAEGDEHDRLDAFRRTRDELRGLIESFAKEHKTKAG